MAPTHTSHSSDINRTHLHPTDAPAYLHRLVAGALNRRGFAGAEAGAMAEMERLLENRELSPDWTWIVVLSYPHPKPPSPQTSSSYVIVDSELTRRHPAPLRPSARLRGPLRQEYAVRGRSGPRTG